MLRGLLVAVRRDVVGKGRVLRKRTAEIDDAVADDGAPGFAALMDKGKKLHG